MKPSNKYLLISAIVLLTIFGFLFIDCCNFLKNPLIPVGQSPQNFIFAHGMSVKKAAIILSNCKVVKRPLFFVILARVKGVQRSLKAGEYSIEPGIRPSQLLDKMQKGDVIQQAFVVVEGWTFSQILDALRTNPHVVHTISDTTTHDEIMTAIGHPNEIPEGRFAPDTYLFSGDVNDIHILMKAYQLMQKRIQVAWDNRSPMATYHCPYEALIVASLIEKETAHEKEKPIIAGVILRRLAKKMLLQIDPSVIYGMG